MALVGECPSWVQGTTLPRCWRERADRFPCVPERRRYNRCRSALVHAINTIRQDALGTLDIAQDRQRTIDGLPVPVFQFYSVPAVPSAAMWRAEGTVFVRVPTKKQTVSGYKLHLLVTLSGVVCGFVWAPASASDAVVGGRSAARAGGPDRHQQ